MKKQVLPLIAWFLILGYTFPSRSFSQKENTLSKSEKRQGWQLLFNGVDTQGWQTSSGKPVPAGWQVANGILTAKKGLHGGDIVTAMQYAGFELVADFNIQPGGNSGLKYLFATYEKGGKLGMEYQILDDELAADNKKANHLTGSFYDVMQPDVALRKVNPPGQWNTLRIISKDKKVEHWLTGVKILEFTRGSQAFTDAVAKSKFSQTTPSFGNVEKGHILLQEHGDEVSFRNIKIKPL